MILNLMLGRKAGGLEQAALDYAQALRAANIAHLSIISAQAWVEQSLQRAQLPTTTLPQWGGWDPLASYRLRRLAKQNGATAIICHGNRALKIALRALSGRIPVIAVAHNYKTKAFHKADACFCITEHARDALATQGMAQDRLIWMPNMVRAPESLPPYISHPVPVIGTMGRFVEKKGFALYLEALGILKSRGLNFHAILGGDGELAPALKSLLTALQLESMVTLPGWVKDKDAFFAGLDVFVLPSHHEPFGIVLIEAMAHGTPVVSTASEGPREILRHGENGFLTPLGDAPALADGIQQLLGDTAFTERLRHQAWQDVRKLYSVEAMAQRLQLAFSALGIKP